MYTFLALNIVFGNVHTLPHEIHNNKYKPGCHIKGAIFLPLFFSKQNVFCVKIDLKNSKQKLLPFSQSGICCICYLVIEVVCLNIQLCRISLKFGDNLYLEKIIYTHSMGTEDHGGIPFLYLNSYIYNARSRHFVMLDLFELLY